ncbi:MAG: fused MFS/spermidine synthase [Pseudomonadales bacterium]|jgi:spermidine synthase
MRILFFVLIMMASIQALGDRVIHKEKSLYRNIQVKESSSRRCLVFAVRRGDRNQTCINLRHPDRVVFPYARMTFAGLLLNSEPESILIVGLGGGTIPTILSQLYPETIIHIVEIDAAVARVAKEYFDFVETGNVKVFVQDARVNIKRAKLKKLKYDMVILDAFTGDYIPEHLMTVEFLQEIKSILTADGVLVANTFSTSKLYDHESVTYQKVYGEFFNFKMPITGNRVIVASLEPLPNNKLLKDRANQLAGKLTKYAINIDDFPKYMKTSTDWDQGARPLTDQFSPANLLQAR